MIDLEKNKIYLQQLLSFNCTHYVLNDLNSACVSNAIARINYVTAIINIVINRVIITRPKIYLYSRDINIIDSNQCPTISNNTFRCNTHVDNIIIVKLYL